MRLDSDAIDSALKYIEKAYDAISKASNNINSAKNDLSAGIKVSYAIIKDNISSASTDCKTIMNKCSDFLDETKSTFSNIKKMSTYTALETYAGLKGKKPSELTNDEVLSIGKGPINKDFDPEAFMQKKNEEKAKNELKKRLMEYGFNSEDADRILKGEITDEIITQRIAELQKEIYEDYCNGNSERYEQILTVAIFNSLYFSRSELEDNKKEKEESLKNLEDCKEKAIEERKLYETAIDTSTFDSQKNEYTFNNNGKTTVFDQASFMALKDMRDSAIAVEEAYDAQIEQLNEEIKAIDELLSDTSREDFTYKSMDEINDRINEINNDLKEKTEEEKKALELEKNKLIQIKEMIVQGIKYSLENDKYRYQSDYKDNSGLNTEKTKEITQHSNQWWESELVNLFSDQYKFMDEKEYRGALLARMLNNDAIIIPDFQGGNALNVVGKDGQEFYFYGNLRSLELQEYQTWINFGDGENKIITQQEIEIFNYICNTEGYEAGYNYLKGKEAEFDQRYIAEKSVKDSKDAVSNPWLGGVSLFYGILEGMSNTGKIITRKNAGQDLHYGDSYSTSNTWYSAISSNLHKSSDVLGYIYDTLYSADRILISAAASSATGGTPIASLATNSVLYGMPTFTSSVYSSKTKGISDDNAIRLAAICATARTCATSYAITKASGLEPTFNNMLTNGNVMGKISSIVSKSSLLSRNPEFSTNLLLTGYCMLSQGTVSGTTAVVDQTITKAADLLINGENSDAILKYKNYLSLHDCSPFEAYLYVAGDNFSSSFATYATAFLPGAILGGIKAEMIIDHQKILPQKIDFKGAFEEENNSPEEIVTIGKPSGPSGGPSGNSNPRGGSSGGPSTDSSSSDTSRITLDTPTGSKVYDTSDASKLIDDYISDLDPSNKVLFINRMLESDSLDTGMRDHLIALRDSALSDIGNTSSGYWQEQVVMSVDASGNTVPQINRVWVEGPGVVAYEGSIQQVLPDTYGEIIPVETYIDGKVVDSFTVIDTKGGTDSFVLPFAPTLASGNISQVSGAEIPMVDWCKMTGAFTAEQLAEVKKLEDIETNITNNGNKVTKEDFNYLYKKSGLPLNFQKKIQQKFENDGLITEKYTTDSAVDSADKSASYSSPDLYHIDTMPQSEIPKSQDSSVTPLENNGEVEKLNVAEKFYTQYGNINQHVLSYVKNIPAEDTRNTINDLSKKYNISVDDVILLLKSIDRIEGACSYAGGCNEIFGLYKYDNEAFKKDFGYEIITKDGKINPMHTMLDLFIYSNSIGEDGLIITGQNGRKIINPKYIMQDGKLDTSNQKRIYNLYGESSIISNFLKDNNSIYANPYYGYDEVDVACIDGKITGNVKKIQEWLQDGKPVNLLISNFKGAEDITSVKMTRVKDGYVAYAIGHVMPIISINEDVVHVSTWGDEWIIKLDSFDVTSGTFTTPAIHDPEEFLQSIMSSYNDEASSYDGDSEVIDVSKTETEIQSPTVNNENESTTLDGYEKIETEEELDKMIKPILPVDKYSDIIQLLGDGYTLDKLVEDGQVSKGKVEEFKTILNESNLNIDNLIAFNSYSIGSNMILAAKRGVEKSEIINSIMAEFNTRLTEYGFDTDQIARIERYIESLDYSRPLYENYNFMKYYLAHFDIPNKYVAAIQTTVRNLNSFYHLDETIANLDKGLEQPLPVSMVLYRAVDSDYLKKTYGDDLSGLVGQTISTDGYLSTSPLYNSSFAKYDDYDVVYEIYAPEGSEGVYVSPYSSYGGVESEVLLNSGNLLITDVKENVIDKNGKTKTIIKAILSNNNENVQEV